MCRHHCVNMCIKMVNESWSQVFAFHYSIISFVEPLDAILLLPTQLNKVATFYLG